VQIVANLDNPPSVDGLQTAPVVCPRGTRPPNYRPCIREPGRAPLCLVVRGPRSVGRDCRACFLTDPLYLAPPPRGCRKCSGSIYVTDLGSTERNPGPTATRSPRRLLAPVQVVALCDHPRAVARSSASRTRPCAGLNRCRRPTMPWEIERRMAGAASYAKRKPETRRRSDDPWRSSVAGLAASSQDAAVDAGSPGKLTIVDLTTSTTRTERGARPRRDEAGRVRSSTCTTRRAGDTYSPVIAARDTQAWGDGFMVEIFPSSKRRGVVHVADAARISQNNASESHARVTTLRRYAFAWALNTPET